MSDFIVKTNLSRDEASHIYVVLFNALLEYNVCASVAFDLLL